MTRSVPKCRHIRNAPKCRQKREWIISHLEPANRPKTGDYPLSLWDSRLHTSIAVEIVSPGPSRATIGARPERASGRPTYDTVYGSVVNKSTGCHDVAGQPAGGVQISRGGSIFVSPSGGGSAGVSLSLPGGVGSVSVSIPKARRSLSVAGYAVNISGSGFYKATANVTHKIQPHVVNETRNGVRRAYAETAPTRSTAWLSASAK